MSVCVCVWWGGGGGGGGWLFNLKWVKENGETYHVLTNVFALRISYDYARIKTILVLLMLDGEHMIFPAWEWYLPEPFLTGNMGSHSPPDSSICLCC